MVSGETHDTKERVPEEDVEQHSPFASFWLGGFESATHVNGRGARLDMVTATQHDRFADEDYALLRSVGIRAAREGIRWHLVEQEGAFDFSTLLPMLDAARRHGVQVIWNLCHYGWPPDVDVFDPTFVTRFARYCRAAAQFIARHSEGVPVYAPMNEISFLAFAAGDVGWFFPYARGRGNELKRQLVRATLAGVDAIRDVVPQARMVHADPIMRVVAPRDRPELVPLAAAQTASQFEAWDMIAGRREPELGGHPRYLDIVGVNFYHSNQWEYEGGRLPWEEVPRDDRWTPLHRLLRDTALRYGRPLLVAETSHVGIGRGEWLREIAAEVSLARAEGVPVQGVCLYPILDRPDWEDANHWHNSGLWDLIPDDQGTLRRVLVDEYAAELRRAQQTVRGTA